MQCCALMLVALTLAAGAAQCAPPPVLPPAPDGVVIEQNVAYLSPDREEKLDLYLPANRPLGLRSPAIVIIHGGGWKGGDKAHAREFNKGTTLAKAGYVCASINYNLAQPNPWPTNLLDCKNAVRFLRANAWRYHIDPDRIGVTGGSAGGHLALMVAYTSGDPALEPNAPYPGISSSVKAVADFYGITDLLTRQKTDKEGRPTGRLVSGCCLVNNSRAAASDEWKLLSPVHRASKTSPPTLILHGTKDATVDLNQSVELAARLKNLGVEHQLVVIEGIGHTFDLQTWNKKPLPYDLRPTVIAFFDRHLKSAK